MPYSLPLAPRLPRAMLTCIFHKLFFLFLRSSCLLYCSSLNFVPAVHKWFSKPA